MGLEMKGFPKKVLKFTGFSQPTERNRKLYGNATHNVVNIAWTITR